MTVCVYVPVLVQPDGQVDVALARKKRRMTSECEAMLGRVASGRAECVMISNRCTTASFTLPRTIAKVLTGIGFMSAWMFDKTFLTAYGTGFCILVHRRTGTVL